MSENNDALSPMTDVSNMFSVDDYMYFYSDYLNPEHSDAETKAIAALLIMDRRMKVLDLACGFGRIANRLARLGHQVTAVEYHPGFLEIARQEAEQMRVRVDYRQSDMRVVELPTGFDRAIMVFNSFGYFTDEENLGILAKIAGALKPGGLLGFDISHRDGVLNDFHPHFVTEKDQNLMINRFSFDVLTGRLHNDRIIIRDGVRKDRPFSLRLYSMTEIREVLREAGLQLVAVFGEWDGQPLQFDSPSMVVVAGKAA